MKKFAAKCFELSHSFNTLRLKKDFDSAQIVRAQGNQIAPELLLKPSDICMHSVDVLKICMKKFDAIKLLFDKMIAFELSHFLLHFAS